MCTDTTIFYSIASKGIYARGLSNVGLMASISAYELSNRIVAFEFLQQGYKRLRGNVGVF